MPASMCHGDGRRGGTRCSGRRRAGRRASRSCPSGGSGGGGGRSSGPCAPARRRSAESPWGWYLPMTSPVTRAHFMVGRSGEARSSCMPQRIRRCTGLRPSRASGRARDDDDRHGVVEEGALHLLLDLDRLDRRRRAVPCRRLRRRRVGSRRSSCGGVPSGPVRPQMSRKRTSLALVWMKCLRRLDVVAHEDREDLVGDGRLLDRDLQQGALGGVHGGLAAARRSPSRPGPSGAGTPSCGSGSPRGTRVLAASSFR